jgi:LuxR family maltose regulon positive regulatory protein
MRAFLVRALVRSGENDRAGAALAETGGQERETGDMRIALAVLRLAQHDPQAATAALGPVLDGSAPMLQPLWQVEALLLDAIARHALGDAAAGGALERALDLAEPDGVVFPFLLHPAPELLEGHTRRGTAHAGLISLVLSLLPGSQEHGGAASPAVADGSPGRIVLPEPALPGREPALPGREPALPEPLTSSETRVLRYLATTHLAAPEIARELFVSVNTVRTHMRHIYAKLGAHRRSEAAQRARALGLLAQSPRRLLSGARQDEPRVIWL